jgi:hypothetical protein
MTVIVFLKTIRRHSLSTNNEFNCSFDLILRSSHLITIDRTQRVKINQKVHQFP